VLVLRQADALPLRARREVRRLRVVRGALPVLPGSHAMSPTSGLLCRLIQSATGLAPIEVEFIADADPRRGWMVRAWLGERTIRDYRLYVATLVPGVAAEALHEWLVEDSFERWPPADIRGGIRRCRCSIRVSGDESPEPS
jgi:hypothetical protein